MSERIAVKELERLLRSEPRSIEDLTGMVAEKRERAIDLLEFDFPSGEGVSGLWIAQKERDVIVHAPSSKLRRDAIIGHELGHILCGHSLHLGVGLQLADIDVARYLAREHFENAREAEAERIGTLIATALHHRPIGWASARLR